MGNLLLKELVREHKLHAPKTRLKNNWGDGYLFEHNQIFRNVRKLVVSKGFSFTTEDFCDYRLFSLGSLPAILKKKKIPYYENFKILANVEKMRPGVFEIGDVVTPLPNYVMHESCHAIAHSILVKGKDQEEMVLKSLLGESLANTADYLMYAYTSGGAHQHFADMNSYMSPYSENDERGKAVHAALKTAGPKLVFKTLWISFLYANFLYERCTVSDFANALSIISPKVELSREIKKPLFTVFEMALPELDYGFRVMTSGFYFKLFHEFDEPIFDLTNFNFLGYLKKNEALMDQIELISDALTLSNSRVPVE